MFGHRGYGVSKNNKRCRCGDSMVVLVLCGSDRTEQDRTREGHVLDSEARHRNGCACHATAVAPQHRSTVAITYN